MERSQDDGLEQERGLVLYVIFALRQPIFLEQSAQQVKKEKH